MKKLIFLLLKYGMRFIYFFMKLLIPVRDKAVFLSRQSDQPSENFLLLRDELQRVSPATECEFYCRLGLKSEMGLSYALLMLRQMKALAGAKLCITESYCIPISILRHKKQLRVVQIWHSMVAVKKFGWQTVDMPEGTSSDIARIMQMHNGYDFVAVGSEYMRAFFSDAMNTPIEKILPLGTPVADRLLASADQYDELREQFYEEYPQARDKKIAVWLPTMRRDYPIDCEDMIEGFDCDKYALVVKLHPLDRQTVVTGDKAIVDKKFTTEQAIILADCIISDYSGAAAEAALEQARDGYARAKQVYDKGSLPEIKWVEVQTRYNQARNAYDIAKRRLDDCSLYAPVGGTVERVLVESGTHAAPGVPVLNIVNTSSLFVRMSIPEVDVNQIGMGSKVVVDISALPDSTGMALPGVVAERDVTADVVAHSYSFRVRLQRTPKGLLPGMVCSCRLPATVAGEGFELPERAVQLANDDSRYVWIVKEGKARRQSIGVADLTRTGVLISNGLQEGDTVIVDGMLKVSEGMTVNPTVK